MAEPTERYPVHESLPANPDVPALIDDLLKTHNLQPTPDQRYRLTRAIIEAQALLLSVTIDHRHRREISNLTEQLVRFCASPRTEEASLSAGCDLCELDSILENFRTNDLSEVRDTDDFYSGYRAFFNCEQLNLHASCSWREGWEAACGELDLIEMDVLALNELPSPAMYGAFGPGDLARELGLPFEDHMDTSWPHAWIRRDLEIATGHDKF